MKLLYAHVKDLNVRAGASDSHAEKKLKKALGSSLPQLDERSMITSADNALLVFASIEKGDDKTDLEEVKKDVLRARALLGVPEIVIGSFAHLSNDTAEPGLAKTVVERLLELVRLEHTATKSLPFGWDKSLDFHLPLHHYNMAHREFKPPATWDDLADDYHAYMLRTGHYEAQYRLLHSLKRRHIHGKVLDVGCGAGEVLKYLYAGRSGICTYIGLDTSERMVSLAKRNNAACAVTGRAPFPARFVHAGVETAEGPFKSVILLNSIGYLDMDSTLERIKGIMSPKAKLIIGEEDPFVPGFIGKCAMRMRKLLENARHVPVEELARLISAKGFLKIDESRVDIDGEHGLVGMVFQKSSAKARP